MNTITDWKVQITWDDGTTEWLDYVPPSKRMNSYLDYLERERYEQEENEREERLESEELEKNKEEIKQ
mgnify:CR=1 FL=1|tara:strand:- start:3879 stop:4082 length:204 start_codon:yes stop_codon:yes gene_type:complete